MDNPGPARPGSFADRAARRPCQRFLRGEPPPLQIERHRRQAEALAEFLLDQLAHRLRRPQRERQLHLIRHLIADPALHAPCLRSRQHQLIAGASSAFLFLETGRAVAPVGSAPPADRAPMHSHRRFPVCHTLLDKKNGPMAQSFLRPLIKFARIA